MALSDIMKEKNMSSKELSEMTGIPQRTIEEYRGKRKKEPPLSRGIKLAEALGVNPKELIK